MALYGGLAENTRKNRRVEVGTSTVTGTLVVSIPAPMRFLDFVIATPSADAAVGEFVTVSGKGTSGNNVVFQLNVWTATGVASAVPIAVDWVAFGRLAADF